MRIPHDLAITLLERCVSIPQHCCSRRRPHPQ
jgi:hypothetical protein